MQLIPFLFTHNKSINLVVFLLSLSLSQVLPERPPYWYLDKLNSAQSQNDENI